MTDTRGRFVELRETVFGRLGSMVHHGDVHFRILIVVVVVVFVGLSMINPRVFLSASNFQSMAIQISVIGLLTLGMSLTMLIAGIDLSITATANLSAILTGLSMHALINQGMSPVMASVIGTVIGLVSGTILGFLNGILIAYGRVTPILATMATLMLYGGVGAVLTGGVSIYGFPDEVLEIGNASIAYVPVPLILLVVCAIVIWMVLNRTAFGLRVRLVGANPRAAAFSGINNRRIVILTHSVTGTLASLAGFISLVRTNSANSQYGASYILMTILIAVLGGVSIFGGKGRVGGIILALVLVQLLGSGMNMVLAGTTRGNFFEDIVWGLLLLGLLTATMLFTSRRLSGRGPKLPPGNSDMNDGARAETRPAAAKE